MKRCYECNNKYPLEAFNSDTSRGDGLQRRCRECDRAYRNNRTPAVAIIEEGITKQCNKCKKELPLANFCLNKQGLYGRGNRCKPCHQDYKRELKQRKLQGDIIQNNYSYSQRRPNNIK